MAELRLRADATAQPRDACDWFRQVMPDEVLTSRLSSPAKLIAGYLWARARWREGTIVPTSHGQLMQLVGRSEKRCREYLGELVDAGFMSCVSNRVGRTGGMEFRVFGPGQLASDCKLLNRPDGDQLSLWPFDEPEGLGGTTAEDAGEFAAETRRKRGGFDGVSAGFSEARAHLISKSVAQATDEETSTLTSTSKSMLMSTKERPEARAIPGKPGVSAAKVSAEAVLSRATAISRTLSERFGSPNRLHGKFVVLAALLGEGAAVCVAVPGARLVRATLAAGAIDEALAAACRGPRQDVSKLFYGLLKDRLQYAAGSPDARMPHSGLIREACEAAGIAWRVDWEQSAADLHAARRDAPEGQLR